MDQKKKINLLSFSIKSFKIFINFSRRGKSYIKIVNYINENKNYWKNKK